MPPSAHVTRLAAAQRQLRAAVRMFFGGEDELAVQTIAATAYRLIAEVKEKAGGGDEAGDFYRASIFQCIRDFRRGTLPAYLAHDPDMMGWVRQVANELPITAETPLADATASLPPGVTAAVWARRNAASTFFKRPDGPAQARAEEADNLQLLMRAYSAYIDLVHDELEAEGLVLWLYYSAVNGLSEKLPEHYVDMAKHIAGLDAERRLKFCSVLIRGLNAPTKAS